jgi:hypothetical protein
MGRREGGGFIDTGGVESRSYGDCPELIALMLRVYIAEDVHYLHHHYFIYNTGTRKGHPLHRSSGAGAVIGYGWMEESRICETLAYVYKSNRI